MRIAICEDDATQAKLTIKYIKEWSKNNHNTEIYSYNSAESFLFSLEDSEPFDVLLLDIQMSEMTGVELAKELRKQKNEVVIIFITALKEFVFEGYDVDALQYILKPMDKNKLFSALDKTNDKLDKLDAFIIIDSQKIKQNDIIYIEAQAHYMDVYLEDKTIKTKKSLKEIYSMLDQSIFQFSHRSYIANIGKIEKIQKDEILLEYGYKIPVSRSKYKAINTAFIDYYTRGDKQNEF